MLSQRRWRAILIMAPKVVFLPLHLSVIIIKYLIMLVFINIFSILECKFLILCSQNTNIYENFFDVINILFCLSLLYFPHLLWMCVFKWSYHNHLSSWNYRFNPKVLLVNFFNEKKLLHIIWTFWTVWHISILLLKITSSIYFRCLL